MTKIEREKILQMIMSDDLEICELGLRMVFMRQSYSTILKKLPRGRDWFITDPLRIFETKKYIIVKHRALYFSVFPKNYKYRRRYSEWSYSNRYIKIE